MSNFVIQHRCGHQRTVWLDDRETPDQQEGTLEALKLSPCPDCLKPPQVVCPTCKGTGRIPPVRLPGGEP